MLQALLTNIQALAKSTKRQHVTKEPYFDRKWGDNAAFQKNLDKASFEVETQDSAAQIHEQILVMYKAAPQTKASAERGTFLSHMAVESMDFIKEQRNKLDRAQREETLCHSSMAAMIEHVFEILKAYSYELNNALGYGPLHVATTNPQAVTEVLKFNKMRQAEESVTFHRGRLSTPSFSLIVRGDKRGIHFYILPVERAIGLSQQECHFIPVMRLSTKLIGNSVFWETDCGKQLTPSMVEMICMSLFERLIEETKIQVRRDNHLESDDEMAAS